VTWLFLPFYTVELVCFSVTDAVAVAAAAAHQQLVNVLGGSIVHREYIGIYQATFTTKINLAETCRPIEIKIKLYVLLPPPPPTRRA
jgi:hypothetical protein